MNFVEKFRYIPPTDCKYCLGPIDEYSRRKNQHSCYKCRAHRRKMAKRHRSQLRRARDLNRIPVWVGYREKTAISDIYKKCPAGMHVDHIIPLQGAVVSGLHVPANLQYLTPIENLRKGNKFSIE